MPSKEVNKTVIGGFVVSAIALLVVGVMVLGSGRFFTRTWSYVLFFEGSVGGLNVGAPVVLRGVQVGTVKSIQVLADPGKKEVNIPVVIEVDPGRLNMVGGSVLPENPRERAKVLIERGLRCQLAVESFVTGQKMIEADFLSDEPARLKGIEVGYPEIPTIQSSLTQLTQKLEKLPFEEIFEKLRTTIGSIEKLAGAPEMTDLVRNLKTISESVNALIVDVDRVVKSVDQVVKRVDSKIDPLSSEVQAGIGDARKLLQDADREIKPLTARADELLVSARNALGQASGTLKSFEGMISERSDLRQDLEGALREIAKAAQSVRTFMDYLERHPEALIQGKNPEGAAK
jgi:paraquat-inducible protein B